MFSSKPTIIVVKNIYKEQSIYNSKTYLQIGASLVCDHEIPVLVSVRSSSWLAPMISGNTRTGDCKLRYRNRTPN